jgi:cation diffusion facilitator CzcD-associated flavoprotein CzcO/surfactin synthase thioesterase subunit
MALVPLNPNWSAPIPATAVIPKSTYEGPDMDWAKYEELDDGQKKAALGWLTLHAQTDINEEQREQQLDRVKRRCSAEQWLDENEREWYAMDAMCRSRPWATKKDTPFEYPFRKATNEMRAAEGPWVGDDVDPPQRPWSRFDDLTWDPIINMRPVAEHPPFQRLILFTPEFGSELSFDRDAWSTLVPLDSCDVWIVSWQGWTNFDEMIEQIKFKVLSFADATSTVWVGHGMGGIVAYELLKRFEQHSTPNLPVCLMVLGCPAPHLFKEEYRPWELYPWLSKLKCPKDFDSLGPEELEILSREFQVTAAHEVDPSLLEQLKRGVAPAALQEKFAAPPIISTAQRLAILGDLKVMRSYRFRHADDQKQVQIPVMAIGHDEDGVVSQESMTGWADYGTAGSDFEFVALEDIADGEALATQGHGFSRVPCQELLQKVQEVSSKYQLKKDVLDVLPSIGPVEGPIPSEVDCVVVGAGITGVMQAKALVEVGKSVLLLDRYRTIGGIWMFYANNYSRVNSSEPAYRIVNQEGPCARPNEDHSPRHDILRDLFTVASQFLQDKIRCCTDVSKVAKRDDDTYDVTVKNLKTGEVSKVHTKAVSLAVNRRIGKRRDLTWPKRSSFRGQDVYGYANEIANVKFWGKRVIVVGAGAFAFENLRTAIEHGARHVTILGRRAGTTCPKWIDIIAFIRPLDMFYATNKNGNIISFDVWRKCYEDAGLPTPECWEEGLLKPHNHTVSVSDLAFIGGYHGMIDLKVGEIKCFTDDGQGVELKSGERMDVDIVIKATGFHLNNEVPAITDKRKIHCTNLLGYNLNYNAEPLLDGGQFGSSKGKIDHDFEETASDEVVMAGFHHARQLGIKEYIGRANPFGSSYVGGMLSNTTFFRWLVEHPEYQKAVLETSGPAQVDIVEQWVSSIGANSNHTIRKIMANFSSK